ncbi:nuclear transport factor 2 family protein [Granulicella arctica]|uniref:nuclear transport factor 2 family protein n=1 Tax=Granulicella arctica TaxID=940613 RepID=UPI0021E05335|nr:nuclear transport factor 2 family protein [Granulicella arctica]
MQPAYTQTAPMIVGTWFGSIVITSINGKISHDTAVLIIEKSGSQIIGGMGRTIDQLTPWTEGALENSHLKFHLDAAGGLNVSLALAGEHLAGTAAGSGIKAQVDLRPAPGLMPHQRLEQEIMSVDRQLYESFGNCDVAGYASFLSNNLEFYQDRTGETGYEQNLKALKDRCAEGIRLRRELDPNSLVVNSAPGFGAIQAGIQRFYSRTQDGQEHLDATASFTTIWSKESGYWKLVRVISYDHH